MKVVPKYRTFQIFSYVNSWWRHEMETFSALLATCAGISPSPVEFPAQRSVTQGFDVFFDLRLNKRLSEQWWGWWFETPSHPLCRHCNIWQYYSWRMWCDHFIKMVSNNNKMLSNNSNPLSDDQRDFEVSRHYLLVGSVNFFSPKHHCVPGPRLNIKTVLSTYGDFHVKDKTAARTSYL